MAGIDDIASSSLESVIPVLAYYAGTYSSASQLTGLTPLAGAPSQAGSYTVLASFPGSNDYATASNLTDFAITKATPQISWTAPASIVYGTPLGTDQLDASASVPGSPSYDPPAGTFLDAGSGQTLSVIFTPSDSVDYSTVTTTTTISVTKATPTLHLTDPGGSYTGNPFPASVTITGAGKDSSPAASLDGVAPTLTYYVGSGTGGHNLGPTAPTDTGDYTVVASFAGSADYFAVQSAPVSFTISVGIPTVALTLVAGLGLLWTAHHLRRHGRRRCHAERDRHVPRQRLRNDHRPPEQLRPSQLNHVVAGARPPLDHSNLQRRLAVCRGQLRARSRVDPPSGHHITLVPNPIRKKRKVVSEMLTAEITPISPGGGLPGGSVIFEILTKKRKKTKTKVLGTAVVSGGHATLTLKANSVLKKVVTVVYSGDAGYLASTLTAPRIPKNGL